MRVVIIGSGVAGSTLAKLLKKDGFDVEQIIHRTEANDENRDYLKTKASKMNHKL